MDKEKGVFDIKWKTFHPHENMKQAIWKKNFHGYNEEKISSIWSFVERSPPSNGYIETASYVH